VTAGRLSLRKKRRQRLDADDGWLNPPGLEVRKERPFLREEVFR
jgi:hypothetical protein